jgi:LysM repeat protein
MCLCISLMIFACTTAASNPPFTPTDLPPITLTLWVATTSTSLFAPILPMTATPSPLLTRTPIAYVIYPGDTLEEIADDFGIEPHALQAANPLVDGAALTVGDSLVIPHALPTLTPQPLEFSAPTCYNTSSDLWLCMGYVRNIAAQPLRRVSLLTELLDTVGGTLTTQVADVEQRVIPPGMTAPYRVMFRAEMPKEVEMEMVISVRSADPTEANTAEVNIENEFAVRSDGEYVVQADVTNNGTAVFENTRVIVTVYTHAERTERVVGYRVLDLGVIEAGASIPIEVAVQPVVTTGTLTHTLYAEGWEKQGESGK